jgi:hypothetical protein
MITWTKTTEDKYQEMLEILPPAAWTSLGFLVGEPWDHNAEGYARYEAYAEVNGKYLVSTKPMTIGEFKKLNTSSIKEAA